MLPNQTPTPTTTSLPSKPIGPIVGGVIGGLAVAALLGFLIFQILLVPLRCNYLFQPLTFSLSALEELLETELEGNNLCVPKMNEDLSIRLYRPSTQALVGPVQAWTTLRGDTYP
jgi:hypothetical protein